VVGQHGVAPGAGLARARVLRRGGPDRGVARAGGRAVWVSRVLQPVDRAGAGGAGVRVVDVGGGVGVTSCAPLMRLRRAMGWSDGTEGKEPFVLVTAPVERAPRASLRAAWRVGARSWNETSFGADIAPEVSTRSRGSPRLARCRSAAVERAI